MFNDLNIQSPTVSGHPYHSINVSEIQQADSAEEVKDIKAIH